MSTGHWLYYPRTSYKSPLLVATRIFMPRGSVHTEWRAEETGSGEASRIENVLTLRSPSSHRITNLVKKRGGVVGIGSKRKRQ